MVLVGDVDTKTFDVFKQSLGDLKRSSLFYLAYTDPGMRHWSNHFITCQMYLIYHGLFCYHKFFLTRLTWYQVAANNIPEPFRKCCFESYKNGPCEWNHYRRIWLSRYDGIWTSHKLGPFQGKLLSQFYYLTITGIILCHIYFAMTFMFKSIF